MLTKRLKIIFGLSIPLFILHGIEEFRTGFYEADALSEFIFRPLERMSEHEVMFITFQIMFWLLLVVAFLMTISERWRLRMMSVLGVVYIVELHHIWTAFALGSYYPGLITALLFPIVGYFFWKELIMIYKLSNLQKI